MQANRPPKGARWLLPVLAAISLGPPTLDVEPPAQIVVLENEARLTFPEEIEFAIAAQSEARIENLELEYGLDLLACGTDVSLAIPEGFEPSTEVQSSWTWDMHRTGSQPPGARIWWRWHLVDAAGHELLTDELWLTWLDDRHPWQTIQSDGLRLNWYAGPETFAQTLLDAATGARSRLSRDLGAEPGGEVDYYIYESTEAMRETVLFEAAWTGALAYPDHGIILAGINEENLDWGLSTVAHELGHIVVGSIASNCYSGLPTWLDEGLAMYAEGGIEPDSQTLLDAAIEDDTLFPVRALSGGFTEETERAHLSYAQSYSLVNYLIETYGRQAMLDLLEAFQEGYRYDTALERVYGFDADGLEAEWREAIGARPKPVSALGGHPTATVYPTFVPYSKPPIPATSTPPPTFTPLPATPSRRETTAAGPLLAIGLFTLSCCAVALGTGALGLIGARHRRASPKEDRSDD